MSRDLGPTFLLDSETVYSNERESFLEEAEIIHYTDNQTKSNHEF